MTTSPRPRRQPRSRPTAVQAFLEGPGSLGKLLREADEQQRLTARLRGLLPADLAPHLAAVRVRRGCLVLFADSPAWASRLRYAAPGIRTTLPSIRAIRIRVSPPEPRARHAGWGGARRPTLSPRVAAQIRAVAAGVSDPSLQQALQRLASHGRAAEGAGAADQETGTGFM
jgi:hypothetical protein